jgi:catechol 2,3-dioxygenase
MTSSASPRLRHLGFFTRDMDNMRRFYTEIMGMTVTDDGSYGEPLREIAFLSSDPGEHHELVLAEATPETEGVGSAQQISFLVDSLEDLRAMHKRATSAGHEIMYTTCHGNAWSFYFRDPDGNRVEVYTHSPWYIPQPHAHDFDLSLSDDEIMRETEAYCREDAGFMMGDDYKKKMADRMAKSG